MIVIAEHHELVKLDQKTILATTVFDIDEVMARIMVFFVMATFLGECAFEHAFDYKNILTQWRTDTNPSLEAFIYADRETRKRVDKIMEYHLDGFSNWEETFLHVLYGGENEKLRDRALIIAGTQSKPIPITDGSPTYQAPVDRTAIVTSDGHEAPNAAGTGPAHIGRTPERPGTRSGSDGPGSGVKRAKGEPGIPFSSGIAAKKLSVSYTHLTLPTKA